MSLLKLELVFLVGFSTVLLLLFPFLLKQPASVSANVCAVSTWHILRYRMWVGHKCKKGVKCTVVKNIKILVHMDLFDCNLS